MFNLDKLERNIIIFLLATLLCGTGILLYTKLYPAGELRIEFSDDRIAPANKNIPLTINVNKASREELMSLKGVGQSLADRIIKYREEHGLFISPEDLKKVPGIGDKLLIKVRDKISL